MSQPVRLIPLIPYDGQTGLLIPFVLERIRRMARERASELDADQAVANIGGRVYGLDPSIALLGFLNEKSQLVGHAVATIESDGTNTWIFISQVSMDPGDWGDAVIAAMQVADQWAQKYSEVNLIPRGRKPIEKMLMATHRADKGWIKKYGFRNHRTIMERNIGEQPEGTEPE
jgi:hypothetical protein